MEPGLNVQLTNGNLGQTVPSNDGLTALVMGDPGGTAWSPSGRFTSLQAVIDKANTDGFSLSNETLYHVSEYFRIHPNGELIVRVKTDTISTASEYLKPIQREYDNEIRIFLIGGLSDTAESETLPDWLNALGPELEEMWTKLFAPAVALVKIDEANFSAPVDYNSGTWTINGPTLAENLRTIGLVEAANGNNITVDGTDVGQNTRALGTFGGLLAQAPVQQNIGQVAPDRRIDGVGAFFQALKIGNGSYSDADQATRDSIFNAHLLYANKRPNYAGIYAAGDQTLAPTDSDYNRLNRVRVLQKITRQLTRQYQPVVNKGLAINADGNIADGPRNSLIEEGNLILEQAQQRGEISSGNIVIPSGQNLLSTKSITIKARVVPLGIAEEVVLEIGFSNPAI
jgi:hypothetical protein